jgi:hypothetical protein
LLVLRAENVLHPKDTIDSPVHGGGGVLAGGFPAIENIEISSKQARAQFSHTSTKANLAPFN